MDFFYSLTSILESLFPLTFWDVLDIIVLSYIIYVVIKFMKETRAIGLAKGVLLLLVIYFLSTVLKMKAFSYLMKTAIDTGIFALIVLFQPELRRTIEKLGHSRVSKLPVFGSPEVKDDTVFLWNNAIDAICDACDDLSATTTGALIVVEMETKLGEQIDNGTVINAVPSKELFGTIFFPKTPLHDGAAIIRDGMVIAAGCFLPKPQNEERIDKKFGSRHRAAIGMSENSDAVIIVVSEETGTISIAENGEISRGYDRDSLKKYLRERVLSLKIEGAGIKASRSKKSKKSAGNDSTEKKSKKLFSGLKKNNKNKNS